MDGKGVAGRRKGLWGALEYSETAVKAVGEGAQMADRSLSASLYSSAAWSDVGWFVQPRH